MASAEARRRAVQHQGSTTLGMQGAQVYTHTHTPSRAPFCPNAGAHTRHWGLHLAVGMYIAGLYA
jgi:hypothetical protein